VEAEMDQRAVCRRVTSWLATMIRLQRRFHYVRGNGRREIGVLI
jgi:hypothetical protein